MVVMGVMGVMVVVMGASRTGVPCSDDGVG